MSTKTILPILFLLASFGSLSAQTLQCKSATPQPFVFESVSFSSVQGSIVISCEAAENLVSFEFVGTETYFKFDWENELPLHYFPMKLNLKPGKAVVKYRMRGEKDKIVELNIVPDNPVKLTL